MKYQFVRQIFNICEIKPKTNVDEFKNLKIQAITYTQKLNHNRKI